MYFFCSCDFNKYTLRYLRRLGDLRNEHKQVVVVDSEGEDENNSSETDDEELMLMG